MPEKYEEEIENILQDSKELPEAPADFSLDQLSLGEEIHNFYSSVKMSNKFSTLTALLLLSVASFLLFVLFKIQILWILGLTFIGIGYIYLFLIPKDIMFSIRRKLRRLWG